MMVCYFGISSHINALASYTTVPIKTLLTTLCLWNSSTLQTLTSSLKLISWSFGTGHICPALLQLMLMSVRSRLGSTVGLQTVIKSVPGTIRSRLKLSITIWLLAVVMYWWGRSVNMTMEVSLADTNKSLINHDGWIFCPSVRLAGARQYRMLGHCK